MRHMKSIDFKISIAAPREATCCQPDSHTLVAKIGEGGAASWGGGAFDDGGVNAFLAAALSRVVRAAVPIPAVAAASVLHSAAVGGFVAGDVGPL